MLDPNSWIQESSYGLSGGNGGFLVATGSQIEEVIAPLGYMRLGHSKYVLSYASYDYTLAYLSRPDKQEALLWLPEPSEISVRVAGSGEVRLTQNGAVRLRKNAESEVLYSITWDLVDKEGAEFLEGLGSAPAPILLSPDPFGMLIHAAAEDVYLESVRGATYNGRQLYKARVSLGVLKVYWPGVVSLWNRVGTQTVDGLQVSVSGTSDGIWVNGSLDAVGAVSYPQLATLAVAGLDGVPTLELYSGGSLPMAKVYASSGKVFLEYGGIHELGNDLGLYTACMVAIGYDVRLGTLTAGYAAVHPLTSVLNIKEVPLASGFRVPNQVKVSGSAWRLTGNRLAWPYPLTRGFVSQLLGATLDETQSWRIAEV